METPLRLLLVEDVPAEAELVVREFARYGIDCDWRRVDTEHGLVHEIATLRPHVIVSDYSLPCFDGLSALRIAQAHAPDVPFLFLSGTIGEETAIESLRNGAMDYLLKNNIARLVPAVERVRREMQSRTERRRATQQLRDIIATSQDWIWELGADDKIVFTSPSAAQILGRSLEAVRHEDFIALVAPDDRAAVGASLLELREKRTTVRFLARFLRENTSPGWLETRALARLDARGIVIGIRGSSRDVTEQQEQQARIFHLKRVLQMVSGVNGALVRLRDRDSLLTETCRLAVNVGEYSLATVWLIEAGGRAIRSVVTAGACEAEFAGASMPLFAGADGADQSMMAKAIRTQQAAVAPDITDLTAPIWHREMLRAADVRGLVALPLLVDGTSVGALVLGTGSANQLDDGELNLLREVAANLSFALQYLQREDAVHFLSYFDALTGLAKRRLFGDRLGRRLASRVGPEIRPAIVVFDIERLGVVNDSAGRHVGDALLQHVSDRLRQQVAETDDLAHLGGGTFCVSMPLLGSVDHAIARLHERIAALFARPFEIEGLTIRAVARAGIARYPEDGENAPELIENAEAALKSAKSAGERFLPYRLQMHRGQDKRLELETRLRAALEERQFLLHYQPKVDIGSGELVGLEALIRWQDPTRGLIAPSEFLPVLEATQMIVEVGEWVLDQALEDARRWFDAGLQTRVAINVSPWQLRRGDFADRVLARLNGRECFPGGLDLEITESALLQDPDETTRKLELLRVSGVGIAIDDFGTGYSSLSRLSMLPVDTLKIDRSFTSGLPGNEVSLALVSTIIALARTFRLVTIAEGVETAGQFETLRKLGCEQSQGYLHGKPQPYEEITRRLAEARAETRVVDLSRSVKKKH
jgi:diguanylate cyclase (GGDEF)-like protein/PAS domain S-box-containing protein